MAFKMMDKPDYEKHLVSQSVDGSVYTDVINNKTKEVVKVLTNEQIVLNPGVLVSKLHHMKIEVGGGRTINLGNFESARIDVKIHIPCDPENLNEAYVFGTNWISEKIDKEIKDAKGL